jgi:hypothetical protein
MREMNFRHYLPLSGITILIQFGKPPFRDKVSPLKAFKPLVLRETLPGSPILANARLHHPPRGIQGSPSLFTK